jgi:HEAT repeat protein
VKTICLALFPRLASFGLIVAALTAAPAQAREEWFRGLDLESSVARADLILVAKVSEVSDAKTVFGGKAERTTRQVKFQPVRTLKGIFTRDELQLTMDDLGGDDEAGIEGGQVRLLILGRSGPGYVNINRGANLDQSVPPLADEKDPFLETVTLLIEVSHQRDRGKKIELLMGGLGKAKGPAAVVLLHGIQRRALLAAQTPGIAAAVTKSLGSESAAVREAATFTLSSILAADYLDQKALRTSAVTALLTLLGKDDMELNLRLSALQGLASAGSAALNKDAAGYLKIDAPHDTFAERTTIVRGIGELKMESQRDAVSTLLTTLPLDAPSDLESAASTALRELDAKLALKVTLERLRKKSKAGLGITPDIALIGEFPKDLAAPALVELFKQELNHSEKYQFAAAAQKVADARLVPALTTMLSPRHEDLRWQAFEALNKIDTDEAARAMRPHLKEELNLHRKLIIAAFLGRHGIRDGYPYAMEHVSEPGLTEAAVQALAAIRDPRAVPVLRQILKESNDTTWNSAAIRALGALGEKEFAPQFLEYIQDLKNPLAPAAIIALADLGEVKALPKIREGLSSRNEHLAYTCAHAAGKLLAIPGVKADELRDQLAALFADGDASEGLRRAALEALVAANDPRLDKALLTAVRDGSLEHTSLLQRTEDLLAKRKVKVL